MKRKSLLFTLLLALFMPWAANAQETVTVCDGSVEGTSTTTNNYVPIYGLYVDTQGQNSEFIIPAETEGMGDLVGGTISNLVFYITNSPESWGSPTVQVYMGEVEGTTLSSLNGPTNFTTVWTGTLSNQNATMEITLSEPYTYQGGNLLIGMYVQTKSTTYKTTSFSGISAPSGSSRYNNGSGTGTAQSFLPKTTFTYIPSGSSYCAKPTNVAMNLDGTTATVTWEGEAVDYNIDVNGTVTNNITSPYTFEVELSTTYTIKLQANCEGDLQSSWTNPVSLTTPDCWNGHVIEYTLNDSYGDGWNGNAIQVVEGCGNIVATLTIENGSSNSGTLNLCGEYYEFVWVNGNYASETSFTFTENGTTLFTKPSSVSNGLVLYTLGTESCARPTNLAVSNVTNHSATLTWTGAEGQNDWEIKYNAGADFDPETEGTLVEDEYIASPHTFNKTLEASTHYYVYVRANCGDENYSCWVGIDFTTGAAAPSPTITTVDEITPVSAVLRWTSAGGDFLESYDIYYSQTSGTPTDESEIQYTGIGADYTSYILQNLTEGSWYVNIRAYHGETDGYSSWASYYGYSFQVPEACPEPTGLTASDPTPNSITLTWTEGAEWQYAWKVAYSTDPEFNPEEMDPETFVEVFGQQGPTITCTATGLDPETTYYFRVLGNCNSPYGDSDWTNAVSATTMVACPLPTDLVATPASTSATLTWTGYSDSYTVQYRTASGCEFEFIEGFEGGSMPAGWTQSGPGTWNVTAGYGYNSIGAYEGTYNVRINHGTREDETYLITPKMDLSGVNDAVLSFMYINYNWGSSDIDQLYVYYRVNEGEWNELWSTTEDHQEWTPSIITLPNLSADYQIGFKMIDKYGHGVGLDDIIIIGGESIQSGEWITYSDNVTSTTATIEGLEFGTRYNAQVKANCGEEYCDYVTFTTNALKTFTTEGDWSVADNWTPAGVPTIEDVVSIEAAATITDIAYAGEITINGGSITIADGGQLVHNNTGVAATVKKTILGVGEADWNADNNGGYYFIANPLTSSVYPEEAGLITEDGNYDLYDWAAGYELEWRNYKDAQFSLSYYNTPAYLYANMSEVELAFNGTVRSSENRVSAPVYVSNGEFGTWNLIGNPFVCNAYLVDNAGAALPYYKMNEAGDSYDAVTGEAIAPVTGIFYEAPAGGSVYFTREAPAKSGSLNMVVSQGRGVVDNAIIRFGEGQQMSKFSFRENSSKIYMPVEGKDYAIVNANNEGEMPVSFKAENNGSYTLSFNAEEVSFSYLHLIDNMTGNDVNLLETPSYSFEAKTTDYANRFRLVFVCGDVNEDNNFAFYSNGSFVINNEGNATVQVIDVTGRILSSETINGCANVNMNAAAGVYMLRLINGDNVKVQKVVVR